MGSGHKETKASASTGIDASRGIDRRRFLELSTGAVGLAMTGSVAPSAGPFRSYPFTLGIASGDPLPDSVVIWTRLAPDPLHGGGMTEDPFPVEWMVATDEAMTRVVRRGTEMAYAEYVHTVHVDVNGLEPDREYFYRFRAGGELSPTGRTRTAPAAGASVSHLSFAVGSCQAYPHGYFTAHQHVAQEDISFMLWLGDYIYESPANRAADLGRAHIPDRGVQTLDDYRMRYTQYRMDAPLQAAHAAAPWIIMADNHEVSSTYVGFDSHDPNMTPEDIARLRTYGFRAHWEHSPIRASRMPRGPYYDLYRKFSFGDLATVNVLDERQYRSPHVDEEKHQCTDECRSPSGYCYAVLDPDRTMLGSEQKKWLLDELATTTARWNILGNPVLFSQIDHDPDPSRRRFNNTWDGYPLERQQILDLLQQRGLGNTVVVTGDSHRNWVLNTPPRYDGDWSVDPIATEFGGTSLTTGSDRNREEFYSPDPVNNPQLLFQNDGHGYLLCTLDRDVWETRFRVVDTVEAPESPIRTMCTWAVENGRPGAQLVSKS